MDENGECLISIKAVSPVKSMIELNSCVDEPKKLNAMMSAEEQQLLESYMTPTTRYLSGVREEVPIHIRDSHKVLWCPLRIINHGAIKYRHYHTSNAVKKREHFTTNALSPIQQSLTDIRRTAAHNGDFDEYINAIKDYPEL